MRRAFWMPVAVVLVVAAAGAVVVLRPSSTSPTHSSLAQVKAALVPLSDMPAGTGPIKFVGRGDTVSGSCSKSKPRVTPIVRAQASFAEAFGPKVHGGTSRVEEFVEVVSVYAKGAAAQQLNDLRMLPRCPTEGVAPLAFPRVTSDQVSYQQTIPNVGRIDFIDMRVNDSAIVAVAAEFPSGSPDASTEAFVRKAYRRARSKLGG